MRNGFVTMLRTMSPARAPLAASLATMTGTTTKAMIDPARSNTTVVDEAPTMERYSGSATLPPSTVVSRYLEKCEFFFHVNRAVSGPTTSSGMRNMRKT